MLAPATYFPREFMARAVFTWLFLVLVYFFVNNSLLSQMQQPVLIYPGSDNSFWLLHILYIPQFLLRNHAAALVFDIILTCSCLICIFVPQQKFFTWVTVIGVWLLYVCFCTAAGKHYAQVGYLLAPLPFLALRASRFDLLWNGFRYWVCFLYASAGFYKLYYGGFLYDQNMSQLLWQGNADWFIFNKSGFQYDAIRYGIEHPVVSQWMFRLATLAYLALLVGFFNKRFDGMLLGHRLCFPCRHFFFPSICVACLVGGLSEGAVGAATGATGAEVVGAGAVSCACR